MSLQKSFVRHELQKFEYNMNLQLRDIESKLEYLEGAMAASKERQQERFCNSITPKYQQLKAQLQSILEYTSPQNTFARQSELIQLSNNDYIHPNKSQVVPQLQYNTNTPNTVVVPTPQSCSPMLCSSPYSTMLSMDSSNDSMTCFDDWSITKTLGGLSPLSHDPLDSCFPNSLPLSPLMELPCPTIQISHDHCDSTMPPIEPMQHESLLFPLPLSPLIGAPPVLPAWDSHFSMLDEYLDGLLV